MRKHHLIKLNKFVCCLVILSLFFQFVPSREPAQAADKSIFERAGDWLAKLTTKIALPDITLDEKGDLMVGTFNLVNCIGSDTEVIDGHKICKDPVNPFSQFKLSMNGKEVKSQIALVEPVALPNGDPNPEKGELTMPEPSLPEICDLSIPLPGDNGCSGVGDKCESKILAKNKACIALNRLQESAAQEVYSAYKIFNATDPFTDCLFVRNCRTNCSLRIGEIAFTVSLLDVAALFVPGGFLNVIQKILNIAKMINQAFKIFTAIKEALSSGVTFLNDLFKVMGNLSAMYASFTNLGLNWSDMLIYGAGSFASQYGGNKLKEIGLDRGGNIGLLEDKAGGLATAGNGLLGGVAAVTALNIDKVGKAVNGMQDMLGNFAQNNLKFAAAKTAALKANDKLKANVDDIRSRFKAEPEFSFFFKTGGAQDTAETSINKQKLDNILSDFQLFFRSVDAFLSDVKQAASLKDGRPISDLVPGGGLAEWQDRFDPPNQLLGLKYVCDEDEGVELPLGGFLPVIPGGIYQCYVPNMVTPVSSGWVDSFQKYVDNTFYLKDYFALTDPEVVKKAIIGCDDLSCFNPGGCPDGPVATDCISCYGTTDPDGCSVNYNNKTWREYWDKLGRTIGSFNNVKAIYNNCKEYVRPDINRHNLECAAELKNIIVELVGPNLSGHFYTVDEALNFSEKDAKYKNLFELYQAEADDMREKQEKLQYMLGVMYPLLYQFKNTDPVVGVVKTYNGIARLDEKVNGQGWKDTRGGINDALFALKAGQMNTTYMNSYPAFRLNITNQFSEDLVARTDGLDEPALGSKFWNDYWFSDSELTIYPNNSYVERRIISDKPYEGEAAYEDWDEKVKIIGANQSNFKNVKEALSLGVSPEEPIVVYKIAKANKVLDNIKSLAGNVDNPDWNVMAGQIIDSIIYGIPKSDPACLGFGCNEATQNLNLGRFRACCENGIYQTQIYPNEKDFRNYSNCCVDEDKVDAQGNSIPSQSCCALGNKCNEGEISDKVFYDKYVPLCNTCINGTCACLSCGGGGVNPPPVAECGNGVIEGTEQCDDHNTNNGDGCSADCKNEVAPPSQCYSCFLGACRAIAGIGYLDPFCYDTCNTSPLPSGTACASNPNNASQWCACQKTPDQFYINNGVKIALPICYNTPTNCTYDNSNCSVVIAPPHDFDCTSPTIQYYDCVAGTCAEVNYTTPYTDDTCGGIVCEVPILPPGSVCASNPNNASQWCACQKTPDQFYTNNGVKIALPSCYPNCIYSNSNCIATPPVAVCSNGIAEGNEKCDGSDLNGKDCMDFGYVKGDLTCNNDCTFNKDDCSSESGPVCNNGIIEIGEQCDLSNFNGKTCQTYGFTGGTLSCLNSCTRIGTVNCGNFYQCLNGLCVPGGNRNNNDPNCGGGCGTTYYTCDSENIGHCKISNFGATDYTTQASCEANNRCGVPNPVIYKCLDLIDWLGSGAIEHYCVCREGEDLRTCGIRVSNVPIDERECYTSSGACPYPLGFLSNNQKFVKVNIFDSIKQKVGIFVKNLIKIPEVFARTVFGECNKLGTRKYECVVDGEVLYTCDDCTNKNCLNGSHPGYPNGCEKEVADPLANEDKYCYPDSNCNSNVCEDTQADCKFYCLDDYCNGYNDPCTLRDYYEQTYQCYDTHEKLFSDGYSKYDSGTTTVKFFNDNRGTLAEAITLTAQNLQDATLALSVAFEKLQRDWNATPEPFSSENQESAMVSSTIHKILQLQENSEKIINDIIPNRVIPTLNIIKTNRDFIQSIISAAPGSVNVDVLKNIVQGFNDAIDALQNSADEDGDGFPDGVIDFAYAKIGPKDLGTNYRCGIGKCSSSRTTFLCSLKCFEEDNQRTFKQLTTYTEILRNVENAAYGLTQAGENIKAIEPSMDMKPVTIKPNLVNELDERAQCCKSDCKTTDNANENKCEYISYSVINKNGDTQKNPVVQCSWTTAKCKEKTSLYVGQQTGTSNYEFFKTNLLANPLSTLEDRFKAVSASVDLLMDENVGIVAAFGDSTKNLDGLIKNNNVYGRDSNKRKEYTKLSEAVLKQARYMWWDLIWGNAGVSQELLPACSAAEQILTNDPSDIQNQCQNRINDTKKNDLLPPNPNYDTLKAQCQALTEIDLDVLENLAQDSQYIDKKIVAIEKQRTNIAPSSGDIVKCPKHFCVNPDNPSKWAPASEDPACETGTPGLFNNIIWDINLTIGERQWPPNIKQSWQGAQDLCISTQGEIENLNDFAAMLGKIGGPDKITDLTDTCNNLAYQEDLKQDCDNFEILKNIWRGVNSDEVNVARKAINGFCRAEADGKIITETIKSGVSDISDFFGCSFLNGNTVGIDLTAGTPDAQQAREVALKLCSQSTTDMRTPLNEVMKVFSVLLGVKSGTVSVNGLSALYFDAQKIRQRAQDVINLIKEAPKKFEELWNSKDEVQKLSKDNVDIKYVKCIAGPMISYAGNGQALTGANGGQVCPNVGEQFSQLDASFSDIRQNLRMIDMARIQPTKAIGFGNLSLDIPKIELIDQDLNEVVGPIYEKAQEIKNKSQLLWALATAINYANENCTCGQSYCPQLGPVPLCISGLPLTIAPLTQPFCHLIWTLRYSLGSLAEKLKQELEKQ